MLYSRNRLRLVIGIALALFTACGGDGGGAADSSTRSRTNPSLLAKSNAWYYLGSDGEKSWESGLAVSLSTETEIRLVYERTEYPPLEFTLELVEGQLKLKQMTMNLSGLVSVALVLDRPVVLTDSPLTPSSYTYPGTPARFLAPDDREVKFTLACRNLVVPEPETVRTPAGNYSGTLKFTTYLASTTMNDWDRAIIQGMLEANNMPPVLIRLMSGEELALSCWLSPEVGMVKWSWEEEEENLTGFYL